MATSTATAWVEGRVLTGRRRVEALLIDGGRVIAAGSSEEVRRARPTGADTRALHGRLVVPGLVDNHCHLSSSVLQAVGVDLAGCSGVEEMVRRLADAAEGPGAGPILGYRWDESGFRASQYPGRSDLDRASPTRPIVAFRRCLHVAVANSAALARARVDESTRAPRGGRLGRDRDGLDGVFYDSALSLLRPIEQQAFAAQGAALVRWLRGAAARGLTTSVAMSATIDELQTVPVVFRSLGTPMRLRAYVRADELDLLEEAPELRGSEALKVVGVKLYADGALGPRTAWLSTPYADQSTSHGRPGAEPSELAEGIRRAADRQLAIAVHAIGDKAVHQTLRILRSEPPFGLARIEHASVTPPYLFPELAAVRPALVVQPSFVTSDRWIPDRLGAERARWAYAFRSLRGLGLHVAGSSDAPVEAFDPWAGMSAATGPRPGGAELERLTPLEALSLYTTEGGAVLSEPGIGQLEPGAYADFLVLDSSDWATALARGAGGILGTYCFGTATHERAPEIPAS